MELSIGSRLRHAWNAFRNRDPTTEFKDVGMSYSYRPDRPRLLKGNDRSIATSVFNRIALDAAAINIQHVRLDEDGRFSEVIKSGLNNCLTLDANLDQTGRAFKQDAIMSMLSEGCITIVPVETTRDPNVTDSYDVLSLRVGKILEWYPAHVRVELYNERIGRKEELILRKNTIAIIENPLYAIVNEPNSTMQRLIRKLSLLDVTDEQTASGKLDLIIQLPYVIKTEARRQQADQRRKDIESQLAGSKYGIAYTDGTERITQLNRSLENNLMKQIEYLTNMVYSQLGITQSILDGTADEKTMLNYNNRTIEPIVAAVVDEMKRKFLTKTARSQGQSIEAFRDPFKLVPLNDMAEIADKFTRNEILSSNEIRQIIGMKPSSDPKADQLINSNIAQQNQEQVPIDESSPDEQDSEMTEEEYLQAVGEIDKLDEQLDELEKELDDDELKHYASPYYDPVKAHEYYMRTRELRARRSTAKLNEEGKSAARYVKEQLTTERKAKVQDHKDRTNESIDDLREEKKGDIESYKNRMQAKIDTLRNKLKNMSKADKARNKESIYSEIESLREDNRRKRTSLQERFAASSSKLRKEHSSERTRLKSEYDEKYLQELDKIRSTAKFQKVSKRKTK